MAQTTYAKSKTTTGKTVAKFTLLVEFKPEAQLPNPTTGALCQRWTYRSDDENWKYAKTHGNEAFDKEIDSLGRIFNINNKKYSRARLYDNRKPGSDQLLVEWINGKLAYPHSIEKRKKVIKWLSNINA